MQSIKCSKSELKFSFSIGSACQIEPCNIHHSLNFSPGAVRHRNLRHGREHAGQNRRLRLDGKVRRQQFPQPPADRVHPDGRPSRSAWSRRHRHRHNPLQAQSPEREGPARHDPRRPPESRLQVQGHVLDGAAPEAAERGHIGRRHDAPVVPRGADPVEPAEEPGRAREDNAADRREPAAGGAPGRARALLRLGQALLRSVARAQAVHAGVEEGREGAGRGPDTPGLLSASLQQVGHLPGPAEEDQGDAVQSVRADEPPRGGGREGG